LVGDEGTEKEGLVLNIDTDNNTLDFELAKIIGA